MRIQSMWRWLTVAAVALCPGSFAMADMFAGYSEFCGLPVVVGADPQIASARRDASGAPYVHVDPGAMSNWTTSRRFALAHECAHHLLGHTSDIGQMARFYGGTRTQELEADCWAAQVLADAGYRDDITRTVLDQAAQGHFAASGYPSGSERAGLIASCAGGGATADDGPQCRNVTTRCQHAAHPMGDAVSCAHVIPMHPAGDVIPCGHPCGGPFGVGPCHPSGDLVPCGHPTTQHQADAAPCQHAMHPGGDVERVCD